MQIYSGTLRLKKKTKGMIVYGNDVLVAQYVSRALLEKAGLKSIPSAIVFVLSVPVESGSGAAQEKTAPATGKTKATR